MKHLITVLISILLTVPGLAQNINWQKSLGGSDFEWAQSIQQTTDGGFIVIGYSSSTDGDVSGNHGGDDYWIAKLDSLGDLEWEKSLGGSDWDRATSVQQTTDGGYVIGGYSKSVDGDITGNLGGEDYWIVKLDGAGVLQWQKSYGGSNNDKANDIQQTMDGGYIVAGLSESTDGDVTGNHGGEDYWIVKLDSLGVLQWQKSLGGTDNDEAYAVQQTTDGGYIIAGYTLSNDGDVTGNNGDYDYWIVKLDASGNLQWQKAYGGTDEDSALGIDQTADGGYIATGYAISNDGDVTGNHGSDDAWIIKLDGSGNLQWQNSLGGSGLDWIYTIQQTSDGGYIGAGVSTSNDGDVTGNQGSEDYWVVKLDGSGNLAWQKTMGGSGQEIAYSINPTSDGDYIISGGSSSIDGDVTGNQGSFDYWIVKLSIITGIEKTKTPTSHFHSIYPNPAQGQIHIEFILSQASSLSLELTDLIGKRVTAQHIPGTVGLNTATLNVAGLPAGYYSVAIYSEGQLVATRPVTLMR